MYNQSETFSRKKSPMNKTKKKTMFNKRKQTLGNNGSQKGSFKGEDPFNKILYADKSRENMTNSNMDISVSSKYPDGR